MDFLFLSATLIFMSPASLKCINIDISNLFRYFIHSLVGRQWLRPDWHLLKAFSVIPA
jgi:hypothetical protein